MTEQAELHAAADRVHDAVSALYASRTDADRRRILRRGRNEALLLSEAFNLALATIGDVNGQLQPR